MFWKKRKKDTNFIVNEKDFRELAEKGRLTKAIHIDGEKVKITFVIEDIPKELMSSIICESYYKSKWYN